MKKISLLIILFTCAEFLAAQGQLFRFPAVNSDGSKIAFSYQGDIWTASINGGDANRITIHQAYDALPKFSPDGKQIAFSSNRFGNNDIYVVSAEGGIPKRLTFHSSGDNLYQWTGNDNLIFTTRRTFIQVERDQEIHSIPVSGGTSTRILPAVGNMPAVSPNGKYMLFTMGTCRVSRETYEGPANHEIWLWNKDADKYTKLTDYNGNDIYPQWGGNDVVYFLSPKSGRYNLYKLALLDGAPSGKPEQLTNFEDDGIRFFTVSGDGGTIVFEKGTSIFSFDVQSKATKKIDVDIRTDYRFDPYERKTFSKSASDYAVSPNGKYSAVEIHGEIFVIQNDKKKKGAVNLSKSAARDQSPQWLNDSTVVFTSDRDGQYDIYLVSSSDANQTDLFKSLKHKVVRLTDTDVDEFNPVISPDHKKIAFRQGRGKFVVNDIADDGSLSNEKILRDGWDSPGGVAWSPDSRWLAYSYGDLNFNDEIYIHAADNSREPVNVSMHPKGDYSPFWSKDGSKLGFLSPRNNQDNDVWFVWLNKKDWEKTKRDWEEDSDEDVKDKKKDKKDSDKSGDVEPIKIDFDDIYERITQVTSLPGNEGSVLISNDGETFYYTAGRTTGRGSDLYKVKWDGTDVEVVTKGGTSPRNLQMSPDGKHIYYLKSGGTFGRVALSGSKTESLPFAAKMKIDFSAELNQLFEEAWRTLRDGFYDPNFHGQDWEALKAMYKPWCMSASTKTDFQYMFNIMLGQLNASHMGMYGSGREETQSERTGYLGVEIEPVSDGVKILRVVPDSPADKENSKLNVGDIITSVNGSETEDGVNFYSLLINTANEKVLLTVKNSEGAEREVVVRPTSSLRNLLYTEWVKDRRKLTDKYSNGKLGYLHIQGMNWPSFERFQRELTAAGYGKEGIVIDVRYNGGGWTTDYLMTVLTVRQHAYTVPRGAAEDLAKEHLKFRDTYPFSERLPFYPWTKPSIAMCNENSYSNAEIFSHAYKTLGIGTLVGKPTFGAVISTGGQGLIDGSFVRLPFRAWYVKATDENMEWGPAVPNIIVDNSPDSKAKGKDEQLERAVDELLKQLEN